MNLLEINDKYMKNGFVVIRNFFDKDSLLKIEKSIKSHISFHLHKQGVAHIKDLENEEDTIAYFEQLAKYCELKRTKLPQDGYLMNLYDSVDELLRSTIYKLKRLN